MSGCRVRFVYNIVNETYTLQPARSTQQGTIESNRGRHRPFRIAFDSRSKKNVLVHKSNLVNRIEWNQATIQYRSRVKRAPIENTNAHTSDIKGQAGDITASPRTATHSEEEGDEQQEKVTVKTEETDGSTACDHGASESALCEPSSNDDPHLSQIASTSSATSKQFTSCLGSSDNAEICPIKSRAESDMDSLSNQDSENLPMNNVFSKLQHEEGLKYEEVAQNSTAHKQAAIIPLVLKTSQKRKYPSWDGRFKELVDFKKIKGHANVPERSGPLGNWVNSQRAQYRLLKEGKYSSLNIERRKKFESIGFQFKLHPHWDQRFQELLDFKKITGHTNVPQRSGPLGKW
eukprot:scaffold78189_cov53-Attheya_sp.AAC.2